MHPLFCVCISVFENVVFSVVVVDVDVVIYFFPFFNL